MRLVKSPDYRFLQNHHLHVQYGGGNSSDTVSHRGECSCGAWRTDMGSESRLRRAHNLHVKQCWENVCRIRAKQSDT